MSAAVPARAVAVPTATMRAAAITAPGRVTVGSAARPEPGAGEVRVRLAGSGVCASNLPVWEGRPWFSYPQAPGAPGHEGWGTVHAVGCDVDGVDVGDRVAILSYHAFAEYDVAPASAVVPLPAGVGDAIVPGEPVGCAMNVFRRSDIERGHTVAVVGVGFLGALLTRLAAHAGARVIAISRRPFALEIARRAGAAETLPLNEHAAILARVHELTGGAGCDRVIEAVGLQGPLDLASALTRERGRLVIAGYHQDGSRQVDMQSWNWRGLDVINAHERDPRVYLDGIRAGLEATAAGVIDPAALCTHHFSLDDLGAAFAMAIARPEGFLKAVVMA